MNARGVVYRGRMRLLRTNINKAVHVGTVIADRQFYYRTAAGAGRRGHILGTDFAPGNRRTTHATTHTVSPSVTMTASNRAITLTCDQLVKGVRGRGLRCGAAALTRNTYSLRFFPVYRHMLSSHDA